MKTKYAFAVKYSDSIWGKKKTRIDRERSNRKELKNIFHPHKQSENLDRAAHRVCQTRVHKLWTSNRTYIRKTVVCFYP